MDRAPLAYRLLLHAYPRAFRRLYAPELEHAFTELHRRARGKGIGPTAALWFATTLDVLKTAARERASGRGYRFGRSRVRLPSRGALGWLADGARDTGVALRGLLRARGYALTIVFTLALGIGANTAIFSVAYGILIRPLPFGAGDRIVRLVQEEAALGRVSDDDFRRVGFSVKDIDDFATNSATFEDVAEYHRMSFTIVDDRGPHRVRAGIVSANYAEFLELDALRGRLFDPQEDRLGAEPVLVLAHEYWLGRFGGDRSVVGRRVRMNGSEHQIVGVLPPTPQFPDRNDVYLPISACPIRSSDAFIEDRSARMMHVYARLRPGATLDAARMDLERSAGVLRAEHGNVYGLDRGYRIGAVLLRDEMTGRARPVLLALFAVSGLLLVIACANAGSLALARARRRARELDLRSALGAGRGRLVGTLLAEGVLLALVGGAAGLIVAVTGHDVLLRFAARLTTRAAEIELDRTVLIFTAVASVLTGLAFGSVPGWFVGRTRGRLEGAGSGLRRGDRRLQQTLVAAQVAFAFGVLATAGFAIRTAWIVSRTDVGFETESVLSFHVMLDGPRYAAPDSLALFWGRAMGGIRALPGVVAAGRANDVPFGSASLDGGEPFVLEDPRDERRTPAAPVVAAHRVLEPEVFDVLDLRFELGQRPHATRRVHGRTAVVNRTFWQRYMAGRFELGAHARRCQEPGRCDGPLRIVGVVNDGRYDLPERAPVPEVYESGGQVLREASDVMVRVAGDPDALESDVRALLTRLDPDVAVADVMTLDALRRERTASQRFFALLLGLCAAVGGGLALAGVFGVASLAAASRLHELGVRRALGASQGSLGRLVLREGLVVTIPGLVVGLALAIGGGVVLGRWLPGVAPVETFALATACALFLAASLLAAWIPARKAVRADVIEVLHAP